MKPYTLVPLVLLGSALAEQAGPLSLSLQQSLVRQNVQGEKGGELFVAAPKSVLPGDVLSQMVTAQNTGKTVLTGVSVSLPVPQGTRYLGLENTLSAFPTQFSIDGGKTFAAAPLKRKVSVVENGRTVVKEVEVKPGEYNAVRWTIPEIAAGQNQRVGFRVKVQ